MVSGKLSWVLVQQSLIYLPARWLQTPALRNYKKTYIGGKSLKNRDFFCTVNVLQTEAQKAYRIFLRKSDPVVDENCPCRELCLYDILCVCIVAIDDVKST